MNIRHTPTSFNTESLMLMDEVANRVLDHILTGIDVSHDEAALRKLASCIAKYANIDLNTDHIPLEECFPSFDMLATSDKLTAATAAKDTIDPSDFLNLLNQLSGICNHELSNHLLKASIHPLIES